MSPFHSKWRRAFFLNAGIGWRLIGIPKWKNWREHPYWSEHPERNEMQAKARKLNGYVQYFNLPAFCQG